MKSGDRLETDMNVAPQFAQCSLDEIKALLDGGTLTIYSVARPISADLAVDRSEALAKFTFASPAFGAPAADGLETPSFAEPSAPGLSCGTPGFARACKADGTVVCDFSAGPGDREIKFAEIACTTGAPVKVAKFKFIAEGGWPEKPEYYATHPRSGYAMPKHP
jgi:hypothetical protein